MNEPMAPFSGLEDIVDLGPGDGLDMRPTLLRVLTDLYLQRPAHTPEDERYYTELALRLIDATDIPGRTVLAARLASYPAAPRPVIERLARDVIEVAGPILAQSPCLTTADFEAIAKECGTTHADAIASRPSAPPAVRAASPADTARREARELAELFNAAGAAERRLILINLDYALLVPSQPLCELQRAHIWRLESAALQRSIETVMRELERTLGVSRTRSRNIVNDDLGESIVVAAKAMDLPADVLQRILLFMNPRIGQSVERVHELAQLYGDISVDAARRLIAIWRAADDGEESIQDRHEPVPWRVAAENARRALSEVTRRPLTRSESRRRMGKR
jgi:hypothetical protein